MIATSRPAFVILRRLRNSNPKVNTVIVALSGGVDSAVSAALLKNQGFNVLGVFFRFFDGEETNKSLGKARKIAKTLDIGLKVVDARRKFKKRIIEYFVSSYRKGITPNPCVVCNKEMKFRLLMEMLKKEDADCIATGHYARLCREGKRQKAKGKIKESYSVRLLEAKDETKDQSYFLYRLTQKELAKTIFPLGEYRKSEVKKMAKKFKLPVLGNEESQDVCFLIDKDINLFLKKYLKPKPGNLVDEKGQRIGKHKGLIFYTIGQRKGIEIGGSGPYFVIGKNARKNELVVSGDSKNLLKKKFGVKQVNWIDDGSKLPRNVQVRIRYHAEKIPAIINPGRQGKYSVETKKYLRAVTPGQSVVFYRNSEVLGGGIII